MRLLPKIVASLILTILVLAFIMPFFMNTDSLKTNLQKSLDRNIDGNFNINGSVKARFYPTPRIIIESPTLKNSVYDDNIANIQMEEMVVKLGLFSLIGGTIKINTLELIDPIIELGFIDPNSSTPSMITKVVSDSKDSDSLKENSSQDKSEPTEQTKDEPKSELKDSSQAPQEVQETKEILQENLSSPTPEPQLQKALNKETPDPQETQETKLEQEVESSNYVPEENLSYNNAGLISKIFKFSEDNEDAFNIFQISKIKVKNGYVSRRGLGGEVILDVNKVDFVSHNNSKNQSFEIVGDMLVNEIPTQFELFLNTKDNEDSKLIINSPLFSSQLEGSFSDSDINNLIRSSFTGNLKTTIVNPKEFFNKYFSKYILIYGKINSVSQFELSADIKSNKGDYEISNIIIESQAISASGYVNANLSSKDAILNSKLDIKNIDIDSLWSARFVGHGNNLINFERRVMENFINDIKTDRNKTIILPKEKQTKKKKSLFDSLKMNADIKITKARYQQDFLNNAHVNLAISQDGDIQIKEAQFQIPDGGILNLSGVFKKNNNISHFTGDYQIDGKDFSKFLSWMNLRTKSLKSLSGTKYDLSGKIILLSSFSALKDLTININNGKTIINGDVRYNNSKDLQVIDARLQIDKVNLTDYFNVSFERNHYVSPGSLSKKLLWLNTVEAKKDISIKIANLQYHDHSFINQSLHFIISPGVLDLQELRLFPKDEDVNAKISIFIDSRVKPKIELDLEINNFKYLTSDLEDNTKYKRLPFSARFFFLPNLVDFHGKIKLRSNSFTIGNSQVKNAHIEGDLDRGILSITDGVFRLYDGGFKYNGEIVLRDEKSINGNFVFTQVNNKKLLQGYLGLKGIGGVSNISGIFKASGKDYNNFIKSLDLTMQFIGANVKVDKFGLSNLLNQMLLASHGQAQITDPESILFNKRSHTTFKTVKGGLTVNATNPSGNKLKVSASTTGINTVTTGPVDLSSKSFNGLSKIIFITGTRKKQVPINIAISHQGRFNSLKTNANLGQVTQYLQELQKHEERSQE